MNEQYTLTYNPSKINFRPANELEEIFQNINTILGTYKFSVPLFRDFGFQAEFIDRPMSILHPLYVREVVETVEKYEPRVMVEEVKMTAEIDGTAYPIIIFSLKSGVKV
ncbi:hypothetical protein ABFY60_26925 [Lysinibacillus pakistanensis]|uniref:hypothetical protein n=1 Tax=Lysinibacillus pakistanensis TaxID=759811 RepID=UPI003D2CF7BA